MPTHLLKHAAAATICAALVGGLAAAIDRSPAVVRAAAIEPCAPVEFTSPAIEKLRTEQLRHYEAYRTFPSVIEVGSQVWEDAWEWHVRALRQQPTVLATADGRHALHFRGTLVVLRIDAPPGFLGHPQ